MIFCSNFCLTQIHGQNGMQLKDISRYSVLRYFEGALELLDTCDFLFELVRFI